MRLPSYLTTLLKLIAQAFLELSGIGIKWCSLGIPWILDPRSASPTENPHKSTNASGKFQKFPWAVLPWD